MFEIKILSTDNELPKINIMVNGNMNDFWSYTDEDDRSFEQGSLFDVVHTNKNNEFVLKPPDNDTGGLTNEEWIEMVTNNLQLFGDSY